MKNHITTTEAAERLGVTRSHVRWLIDQGRLVGEKVGRDIFVDPRSVEAFARDRPPRGRPKKNLPKSRKST